MLIQPIMNNRFQSCSNNPCFGFGPKAKPTITIADFRKEGDAICEAVEGIVPGEKHSIIQERAISDIEELALQSEGLTPSTEDDARMLSLVRRRAQEFLNARNREEEPAFSAFG